MTFESASPLGNGEGCFPLVLPQLPVHVSNQWHRKITRDSMMKCTKYFTETTSSTLRRLSGVFPERNEMRELEMYHGTISYVCTSWKFMLSGFVLIKWNLKRFSITASLKYAPFPDVIINVSARSSFQPHHFPPFKNDGFILALTMINHFYSTRKEFSYCLLMPATAFSVLSFTALEKTVPLCCCWASKVFEHGLHVYTSNTHATFLCWKNN